MSAGAAPVPLATATPAQLALQLEIPDGYLQDRAYDVAPDAFVIQAVDQCRWEDAVLGGPAFALIDPVVR